MGVNATFAGTITRINPVETVGANAFKKRSFLLKNSDQYPSTWLLETHKDFTSTLDQYSVNDEVTCEVEISGREWQDKAFNTLKAYRITLVKKGVVVAPVSQEDDDTQLPF